MHIGIDGGCWNNRRGYGRYLREVAGAIARVGGSNRYTIFLDSPPMFPVPDDFEIVLVNTSEAVSEGATASSRRSVSDLFRMSRAVAAHKLDLLFFSSVYSYFPLLRSTRMVLGIHD